MEKNEESRINNKEEFQKPKPNYHAYRGLINSK